MLKPFNYFIFVLLLVLASSVSYALELQKATQYKANIQYNGWLMSEKLDGIRGVWNGKQLLTRSGKTIHAPNWFIKNLPPFAIDGELWTKRQNNEVIQSIVMDHVPSDAWRSITYHIFEVPNAKGNFYKRLARIQRWLKQQPNNHLFVIKQIKIKNKAHLDSYFNTLIKQGAEGIIIKNPHLNYFSGRSAQIVKRKMVYDMDALVIGTVAGKGKHKGKMGALKVKSASGKLFKIGTGFTNKQRANPPKIGNTIRFKYYGLTAKGIPKHASFLNIRKD